MSIGPTLCRFFKPYKTEDNEYSGIYTADSVYYPKYKLTASYTAILKYSAYSLISK